MYKELIISIESNYGITIDKFDPLRESSDNNVFILLTNNERKCIVRVSKRDVSEDVVFEISFIHLLSEQGVAVPKIIKTKKDELFIAVNRYAVVMFEFIDGYHIEITPNKKPDLNGVREAGQMLARIHNAASIMKIDSKRKRTIFSELERALACKNALIDNLEGGADFIKEINTYSNWAKKNYGHEIIVQNDYRPGNILFKNKKITAVLDFDWACRGPAIKDLAHSLVEWSYPDGAEKHWVDAFTTFLESYNKEAKEKIELNNSLYKWMCFSCLSDTATYFVDSSVPGKKKKTSSSYMYRKYLYFKKFDHEALFI